VSSQLASILPARWTGEAPCRKLPFTSQRHRAGCPEALGRYDARAARAAPGGMLLTPHLQLWQRLLERAHAGVGDSGVLQLEPLHPREALEMHEGLATGTGRGNPARPGRPRTGRPRRRDLEHVLAASALLAPRLARRLLPRCGRLSRLPDAASFDKQLLDPHALEQRQVADVLAVFDIEIRDRHVVRGYVRKTTDTSQDEDEKGNQTIRETERFEVQIKTLSKDGEIRVLSGA